MLSNSYRLSQALGAILTTTIKLAAISAPATPVTNIMLPLLAGNFPLIIQCWLSKYL